MLDAFTDSPVGRRVLDFANRPRTGRRFPAVPTAVPGGLGDPFAQLPAGGYAAYGTGTAYHTDLGLSGQRGTALDLGFASVAYSSVPVNARFDELDRRVAPPIKVAGGGYGQGDAAQVGALERPGEGESDIVTSAEASAPPNRAPVMNDLTEVNRRPFIDADVLHAEASARAAASGCVVGSDLGYGLGSATDTKALAFGNEEATLSTDGEGPKRAVSQTMTRTRLVPKPGSDRFGLLVETRQTIAPTTIRQGTPDEMTVEVAGEWVLRVTVDGAKFRLDYGPDADSQTVVLRVTRPENPGKKNRGKTVVVAEVTAEQLLGRDGQIVEITDNQEIVVGELPRGIRDDHGSFPLKTGSRIAAATDVARIVLKDVPGADLRIGHMEAAAAVPPEGIACPGIGMAKKLDSASVRPGDRFTWSIEVSNPNDCVLEKVKVVDTITATPGVRYKVVSSDPKPKTLTDGSVVFEGIGPLRQNESRRLLIQAVVDDLSAPGSFRDAAVAEGVCGPDRRNRIDRDDGSVDPPVVLSGKAELAGPSVGALRLAGALPQSSGSAASSPSPSSDSASSTTPEASPTVSSRTVSRSRAAAASTSSARVAAAQDSARGAAPLARTGGLLGLVPAVVLMSTGSLLRRLRRSRA